ncbi:TIGR00300 family protein [Schnuerera sp.]|uniref:ornithine cyclodeaminase n=1 Tax=Schnuerera sp. TaxID=2794844 RepID=UPI002CAA56F6|nr:TIGR00300 family protein [Schnuerera sp.]HSH36728.1 TIGR00300 family protein [Schnuerera sp.]
MTLNNFNINKNVLLKKAIQDKHVPDDFYSTTNHTTFICHNNKWMKVKDQRMDALIVVNEHGAVCKKLRNIKYGDMVVCGDTGVKLITEDDDKKDDSFNFMNNFVSSERRNDMLIKDLAYELFYNNKKLTLVAGPVVVHTGGDYYLSELIRQNYISSLLTGNALAVHDIEKNLYGTSLGVCAKSGKVTSKGYRNHMRAINHIMKYGSIKKAVEAKALHSGIIYECVINDVPFVLAGSLRDDGPLPDTITDIIKAQDIYSEHLKKSEIVLVLGTMLHGIASGNMLPAKTKMICVDINSAVVTKLSDRGSSQAIGMVTDVGLFLNLLANEINNLKRNLGTRVAT